MASSGSNHNGTNNSIPILLATATPSASYKRDDKMKDKKLNMRKVTSFDAVYQGQKEKPDHRPRFSTISTMKGPVEGDDDASTSTLGDDDESTEKDFLAHLEESLDDSESSSESSYWSSSDDDDSDDDSDDEEEDGPGSAATGDISTDEGLTTDTDDDGGPASPRTKNRRNKAKRSDSTLSLDALLKVQLQLGDAKKPPPKDKEARRRGRRLNRDHNATSLGALARKVGSGTNTEEDLKRSVSGFRRTESSGNLPTKPKKFLHIQQEGSAQQQQQRAQRRQTTMLPNKLNTTSIMDQSVRTVGGANKHAKKYGAGAKPRDHYLSILKAAGISAPLVKYETLVDFFLPVTAADKAAFDMQLVGAVRDQNMAKLNELHQSGHPLQARSQFGESLVHICARRGTPEMLRFLLSHKGNPDTGEAGVSCRVCCDYGRTPLHDAAWSTDAKSLEMMKILINECPDLLLVLDKRGFMPLDYIPKDRWPQCCAFLDKHKDMLMPTGVLFGESSESEAESYEDDSSADAGDSDDDSLEA